MTDVIVPYRDESPEDSLDEDIRPTERWAPLGAVASPEPGGTSSDEGGSTNRSNNQHPTIEELRRLEDEQEQLNSALMSLTSHFAQVQFRLKQVMEASPTEREDLLKNLEEFAFRGIPDSRAASKLTKDKLVEEMNQLEQNSKMEEQRKKQLQLIEQLKTQLEDLELYAYETGEMDQPPTSQLLEKQKLVIEQLRSKLDLDLDNIDRLTPDQLSKAVDMAVGQIINPVKVKEKLVDQLKTQIVDLERFIQFLQGETDSPVGLEFYTVKSNNCQCNCPVHGRESAIAQPGTDISCTCNQKLSHKQGENTNSSQHSPSPNSRLQRDKETRDRTLNIMKRALTILQLFAATQLGCGGDEFIQKNVLKRRGPHPASSHWGDLRAGLEVAVEQVVEVASRIRVEANERRRLMSDEDDVMEDDPPEIIDEEYHSDTEEYIVNEAHKELTHTVRKVFCVALRDLLQHGLVEMGQAKSVLPFGCFPSRMTPIGSSKQIHIWSLFLKYYEMKNGRQYNESPARKLSQSFDLNIVGGKAITIKQQLLSAIGTVLQSHTAYKRSDDSKFKALICMALNEKRLVQWLRLIVKNPIFVDHFYQSWSYTSKTGFDDALHSLNRLNFVDFKLPHDLAVRQFKNIKDAFKIFGYKF